jgi:hypothetical protein
VNLRNIALLELPMYRSNPEIILNGWLHALLHINDWSIVKEDTSASDFIEDNLRFFVQNFQYWYDSNRNISRYSDTSPMRFVFVGDNEEQQVRIFYRDKTGELPDYIFAPVEDLDGQYNAYDVRRLHRNGRLQTLGATCSGLFDTVLSSNQPFSIRYKAHGYDTKRATPSVQGQWLEVEAKKAAPSMFVAEFGSDTKGLICGYPTNFTKKMERISITASTSLHFVIWLNLVILIMNR